MKILVLDIDPLHRESATFTLKGHELTTVATYTEAQYELTQHNDPRFDVVMTNLFVGPDMPSGIALAILALAVRVKNVVVVTDIHQRTESMAWALHELVTLAPHANVLCTTRAYRLRIDEDTGERSDPNTVAGTPGFDGEPKGFIWSGRDWGELLERLMNQVVPPFQIMVQ